MLVKYFIFIVLMLNIQQEDEILWSDSFDYSDGDLPATYWSEGCKAMIEDGQLYVDADTTGYRASTTWLDKEFSGDISVEFDVQVISSSDTANNINFFFMYSDPSGQQLRESANERQAGTYNLYHKLNGYIFTNVANGNELNARFRFRDNPGFNLLGESFTGENKIGERHHIKILKNKNQFQYWVDNQKKVDVTDTKFNPLHNSGLIGFRTWHTTLVFDNLVIKKLN